MGTYNRDIKISLLRRLQEQTLPSVTEVFVEQPLALPGSAKNIMLIKVFLFNSKENSNDFI